MRVSSYYVWNSSEQETTRVCESVSMKSSNIGESTTDTVQQQIMVGVSEALKKLMDNENRSSFNLITEMQLLESCQKETRLLIRKRFLFNLLELARQECMIGWKKYTGEVLGSIQTYNVESRYCGILRPVRVLPGFIDRLVQARAACEVCTKRLINSIAS